MQEPMPQGILKVKGDHDLEGRYTISATSEGARDISGNEGQALDRARQSTYMFP